MIQFLRRLSFIWFIVFGITAATIVALLYVRGELGHLMRNTVHAAVSLFPESNTPFGAVRIHTRVEGDGLHLNAKCINCMVDNERLAKVPFKNRGGKLSGTFHNTKFVGHARSGEVKVRLDMTWDKGRGVGKFDLPLTPIAAIYAELASIVPEAKKAKIEGKVSASGTFNWPEMILAAVPKVSGFKVQGLIPDAAYRSGSFSYNRRTADGSRIAAHSGEGTRDWLPLREMGPYLAQAVVAAEDGAFYSHPGFDLSSIVEAAADNRKSGRLRRGGSTLTQQLAKNLFLNGEKTYARKMRELLYAVELEQDLSKNRIMELYLNVVEWGPNIFGAKAAASTYFGKKPAELLPEEAAWLGTILRSPGAAYRNQFLKSKPSMWRVRLALRRMKRISEEERNAALERQVSFGQGTAR